MNYELFDSEDNLLAEGLTDSLDLFVKNNRTWITSPTALEPTALRLCIGANYLTAKQTREFFSDITFFIFKFGGKIP